jgi:hypothetical protein
MRIWEKFLSRLFPVDELYPIRKSLRKTQTWEEQFDPYGSPVFDVEAQ